jgi:hypothetical protein
MPENERAKPVAVFISNPTAPSERLTWFRKVWECSQDEPVPEQFRFAEALNRVAEELDAYALQVRRQQVHIDEIKRLCHVKT